MFNNIETWLQAIFFYILIFLLGSYHRQSTIHKKTFLKF